MLPFLLKFELKRLFRKKWIVIYFLFFFIAAFFLTVDGIREYQKILSEKDSIINGNMEMKNIDQKNPSIEGQRIKVFYDPTPIRIFFNDYQWGKILLASNMRRYCVNFPLHNYLFKGFSMNIAGIFFLIGSLFMTYMGMTSDIGENYHLRFVNILIRLGALLLVFAGLLLILFYLPKLYSIQYSLQNKKSLFWFSLYLLIFLGFFYGLGLLIRVLCKSKTKKTIYVFIFWMILILIIPSIIHFIFFKDYPNIIVYDHINSKAPENIVNKAGYDKNRVDMKVKSSIKQLIQKYEMLHLAFPPCFYNYLSSEIAGNGIKNLFIFSDIFTGLSDPIKSNHLEKTKIDNQKRIFYTEQDIPDSYLKGFLFTLVYTIFIFCFAYWRIGRRKIKKTDGSVPEYRFKRGNFYFILCKNKDSRDEIYQYYSTKENYIGINRVKIEELNFNVGLSDWVSYLCKSFEIDKKEAWNNINQWVLNNMNSQTRKKMNQYDFDKISEEDIYKIYSAIILSSNNNYFIINDFLRGKSRQMERFFLELVVGLNKSKKSVIYLSTDIFMTSFPFEDIINEKTKSFIIDPLAVSLR